MPKHTFSKKILLVGAPACGKSSVGVALMERTTGMPHFDLDTDVLELCAGGDGRRPDDGLIDEAARRLLTRAAGKPSVVELPHHDYVSLITRGILKLHEFDLVVLIRARFRDLKQREVQRRHDVPPNYIVRCVGAVAALAEFLADSAIDWLEFDAAITPPEHVAQCLLDYLRKDASESLAKIEIVPARDRADLGGSLRSGVEWDDQLVAELFRLYEIRTVLDVGCGSGATIEKFALLGADAWGIDALFYQSSFAHRRICADFTRQWVEWPAKADLVWCVEVLEHVAPTFEGNIVRTIAANTGRLAFITAAPPGQPGFHHVNCQFQSYWIRRFEEAGLRFLPSGRNVLRRLGDTGPFGVNMFKANGMLFEAAR